MTLQELYSNTSISNNFCSEDRWEEDKDGVDPKTSLTQEAEINMKSDLPDVL